MSGFTAYGERLRDVARERPGKIAIRDDTRELTYGALEAAVDAFGGWLCDHGLRQGDCIAVCAVNSLDYALGYVALAAHGVVVAPLPQSATAESLATMIRDCGARLVFADHANRARLSGLWNDAVPVPLEGLAETLARYPTRVVRPKAGPENVFNIIYSSGTTGTPKGIVQSNAMREAHIELARACGYDEESVTLISTPLYSNTTLVSFLPTIALGGTAIIMGKFDAEGFLERAERYRATHAMLVPIQYRRLLAHPRFDEFDLSDFREKFCTSAPFTAELKREVLDRWPGGLTEYYGMTEGGGLCILFAHRHPDKLHTVGQPAPDNDIRIIDDDDQELPPGSVGDVVGRSRGMMEGYHNRPDETAGAYWHSPDGLRFMRTGDVGRFDEGGFLTLMDRKKDVIISGGFNIYPSDLEGVLRGHPNIEDAAVVGIPSVEWGETPVAFVVAPRGSAAELRKFANDRLGRMQRISDLRLIDRLPRNAIGKVLKRDLRDRYFAEREAPC